MIKPTTPVIKDFEPMSYRPLSSQKKKFEDAANLDENWWDSAF